MPSYRCYFLDEADRIGDIQIIEAADADSAVAIGTKFLREDERYARFSGIEVWHETALVFTHSPVE